ncbi:Gfo/Idh/MocA family oxidoreductase [Devriesea agamarum]|uniref:Gfo/Idh/MocA family oxidoreductase n=1 Tax=Devriesea agamarum TaxID=472569 RepID=UPI00071D390E|nr:Gfo/Idh/MocA family oxidoreductase [Devriesea agamarum]
MSARDDTGDARTGISGAQVAPASAQVAPASAQVTLASAQPLPQRPRVAVVGATFGAQYARALQHPESPAKLACVVGAGGTRSQALAHECDVPLCTLDEVTDVDAAVVAVRSSLVGGAGDDIAAALLSRGIAVLQELPVHTRDLTASMRHARNGGTGFAVNPFYTHLEPVRRFIARAQELQRHAPVYQIVARTCGQTLHSTLHVLAEVCPGPPPRHPEVLCGTNGHLVRLDWSGIDVDVVIGARLDPKDPDNLAQPLMSYTLSHSDGELHLDHPHGPCRWLPRPHVIDGCSIAPDVPAAITLPPTHEPTARQVLAQLWPKAIHRALRDLLAAPKIPDQRTLAVLRLWETISAKLPPATPAHAEQPHDRTTLLAGIQ